MSRREIREHIFKLLFLLEFYQKDELNEQAELYLDEVEEAVPSDSEAAYIRDKFHKIEDRLEQIDQILSESSTGWKLKRMGKVDLAVMRLAVYEIRYDDEIPTGVAINEAVELAKKFGGDDSPSFVNGVLAKVVPENEKEQAAPAKTDTKEGQASSAETEAAKEQASAAEAEAAGKQASAARTGAAKKQNSAARTGAAKKQTSTAGTGTAKKHIVTAGTWNGKRRTAGKDL